MTAKQQSKLAMYNAVIGFCYEHGTIFQLIPAFQTSLNLFQQQVGLIAGTLADESDRIGGVAAKKSELREDLEQKTAALAFSIFAYASSVGDTELKGRVDFTKSDIARLRDDKLCAITTNILGIASQHLAKLTAHSVTAATITELTAARDLFMAVMARPRLAVTARSKNGDMMTDYFTAADTTVRDQMDKMIGTLSASQPDIYIEYNDVRLIVDSPTTTTQIKGTITNKDTNEPINDVIIEIEGIGIPVTSDEEGEYLFKPVPHDTYTIIFTKKGFTTVTITEVDAKLGQVTRVDVEMAADTIK